MASLCCQVKSQHLSCDALLLPPLLLAPHHEHNGNFQKLPLPNHEVLAQ
jgi:hypothetical protein